MKLNGWQRLWVVCSALWLVLVGSALAEIGPQWSRIIPNYADDVMKIWASQVAAVSYPLHETASVHRAGMEENVRELLGQRDNALVDGISDKAFLKQWLHEKAKKNTISAEDVVALEQEAAATEQKVADLKELATLLEERVALLGQKDEQTREADNELLQARIDARRAVLELEEADTAWMIANIGFRLEEDTLSRTERVIDATNSGLVELSAAQRKLFSAWAVYAVGPIVATYLLGFAVAWVIRGFRGQKPFR